MNSLRTKTLYGIFWSLIQGIGGRGITFMVTIILARILTPEIFGLIGMLAIFLQISHSLAETGFNDALIQKRDPKEEDYSSVFWVNLGMGVLIYTLLFLTAPYIAAFYRQPILIKLTRVLSLLFVINAFSYVQETKLRKDMRFRTLTIIHLPSTIIGGIVGILMALKDYGVWSIVAQQLVTSLIYALQIWIYAGWKPVWSFNIVAIKSLFSFGSNLMISSMLSKLFQNIYLVLIGRFFSLEMVGYYQNARTLTRTPAETLSMALNSVAFPAFSSIQDNNKKLKEGYKTIIQQLLYWTCPIFIFAGVLAPSLFSFVLTNKWLPAVPYFRLLCIVAIFYPLNSYNLEIIKVKGRSDLYLKLSIIKKIIVIIGIGLTLPFGVWFLLTFQAVNSIISYFINSYYSGRFISYSVREQINDIFPILILSIISGVFVFFVSNYLPSLSSLLRLLSGFVAGTVFYLSCSKILNLDPYIEFRRMIKTRVHRYFRY